ncbi:MAG: hypothetical protein Tsb0021_07820 [Chlamydiales bacterium]
MKTTAESLQSIVTRNIVGFESLKIPCVIGVYPEERLEGREIIVSLSLETRRLDYSNDTMEEAIDYCALAQMCMDIAQSHTFHLLETYAQMVLNTIKEHWGEQCYSAEIKIQKPGAISNAACSFVKMGF